MSNIIELIYNHRQSQLPPNFEQRDLAFSCNGHGTSSAEEVSGQKPRMKSEVVSPRG
jgi:hypothetical protein